MTRQQIAAAVCRMTGVPWGRIASDYRDTAARQARDLCVVWLVV